MDLCHAHADLHGSQHPTHAQLTTQTELARLLKSSSFPWTCSSCSSWKTSPSAASVSSSASPLRSRKHGRSYKHKGRLFLLVSNIRVSQFASVGSGDASLGSGKSAERGSLQSGDTCGSEGSPSLQVLDRELATYQHVKNPDGQRVGLTRRGNLPGVLTILYLFDLVAQWFWRLQCTLLSNILIYLFILNNKIAFINSLKILSFNHKSNHMMDLGVPIIILLIILI